MVDKNDAMFRELEDEMRRERFATLWQRYGIYFVLAAVAIVVGVAGAQIWQSWTQSRAETAGADYTAAANLIEAGKIDEAASAFAAISSTGPKGYATLASFAEAGILLKQDKHAEALAIFDRLANDRATDPLLSNLARLQAATLKLGEADFTEMENRLKPLTGDDNPWRFRARELLGTAALKAGKLDEARTLISPLLADPNLSRGAAERVNRLMSTIAAAEGSNAPAASATTAPAAKAEPTPAPAATSAPVETEQNTETPASAP